MKSNAPLCLFSALLAGILFYSSHAFAETENVSFTGDKVCAGCHETVYTSFTAMAPQKANPSEGFPKLLKDFSEKQRMFCYHCHVTGAGKSGGFVSYEQTPDLGHVGCETCHGPGSRHAESGDPDDIVKRPEWKVCVSCHDGNRVSKPALYGRPHGAAE